MDVGCSEVQVVDDLRIIENDDERTSSAESMVIMFGL